MQYLNLCLLCKAASLTGTFGFELKRAQSVAGTPLMMVGLRPISDSHSVVCRATASTSAAAALAWLETSIATRRTS